MGKREEDLVRSNIEMGRRHPRLQHDEEEWNEERDEDGEEDEEEDDG